MAMSVTYTTIGGVIVHEALSGNRERELTADPLGSLVKIRTSAVNYSYSAEYWPYGEIQTQTGSNPTRWAFVGLLGYMRDLATMFYVRARYYRSALTRWMTVDPLWPGELAYQYVAASPLMFVDAAGMQYVYPPGPYDVTAPGIVVRVCVTIGGFLICWWLTDEICEVSPPLIVPMPAPQPMPPPKKYPIPAPDLARFYTCTMKCFARGDTPPCGGSYFATRTARSMRQACREAEKAASAAASVGGKCHPGHCRQV